MKDTTSIDPKDLAVIERLEKLYKERLSYWNEQFEKCSSYDFKNECSLRIDNAKRVLIEANKLRQLIQP